MAADRGRLERVHLELTNRCNFRCEFCPQEAMSRPLGDMAFGLFERLAGEIARERLAPGVAYHVLGEPLLYRQLPDALELTRRLGLRAFLTTNGSLLTPARAEAVGRSRPHFVAVSVQTPDESSFRLRGAEGMGYTAFRRQVLEGVATLLATSPETRVSVCLLTTPLKWAFFPATRGLTILDTSRALRAQARAWADDLRVAAGDLGSLYPAAEVERAAGRLWVWRQNRLDLSPRLGIETRIAGDWGRRARLGLSQTTFPARRGTCHGLTDHAAVLWDGTYAYCCMDYDGRTSKRNAADTTLAGFLDAPEVRRDRKGFQRWQLRNPACRECLGGPSRFHRFIRQTGSIFYQGVYRKWLQDPWRYREG